MPEGDTIHTAAMNLRKVLDGNRIVFATGRHEVPEAVSLVGHAVSGLEARGKHLLIHFDDDRVLHSHLGMTGSWHIYPSGWNGTDVDRTRWQKPVVQAAITLANECFGAVCFNPKLIRLISETELSRDPWLQKLGPDLLGPPVDDVAILVRFRSQNAVPIGEAIMNQTVVSGIGNVYKSELLFLAGVHPLTTVGQLTDTQLMELLHRAIQLMKRNLTGGPRKTRFRSDGTRHWVYGRSGEDCLKCGCRIQQLRQGDLARSTYFCPACQPE
ncbi:MAG: DNA-formamidopyrimidine glycosylase family protein [Planctomycetaceae bacterium]